MHIGGRDEQAIWIISFLWNICFKRSFCIHGKKYSYFNMPTECWIISVNIWRYTESKTPAVVPDFNWQVLSSSSSFSQDFSSCFRHVISSEIGDFQETSTTTTLSLSMNITCVWRCELLLLKTLFGLMYIKTAIAEKKTAQKRQKFLKKELSANSTVIFFLAKLVNFDFQGQAHLLTLLH